MCVRTIQLSHGSYQGSIVWMCKWVAEPIVVAIGYVMTQGIWLQDMAFYYLFFYISSIDLNRYGYELLNISLVLPSILKTRIDISLISSYHFIALLLFVV